MNRRELIALAGAGVLVRPRVAHAQDRGRTYRLAFLIPAGRETAAVSAFFDELSRNGFSEGQNLIVVWGKFSASKSELAESAAALVESAPDAIIAGPERPLRALQAATRTIPIIGMTEDMVGENLAAGLARPGGNMTGISLLSPELDGKRQDILLEAVPGLRRMGALADSTVTLHAHIEQLTAAAAARGIELSVFTASGPNDIVAAIDAAKAAGAEALNILAAALFTVPASPNIRIVIERVAKVQLPAIYQWPEAAEQGGLVAYGPRFDEVYRQRARMAAKTLRGVKPADLPVEQPTKFELLFNLRAAKALGLTIPESLLVRADKVIE